MGGRISFEAARAALAFLAATLLANSCAIFSSSPTVVGRAISIAEKPVAFGYAFSMASARGPKGDIVLSSADLLESLGKGALAAEGVEVVMVGGGE